MNISPINSFPPRGVNMTQPPDREEVFKKVDSNADGAFDKSELSALGEHLSSATGKEFDLEAIMSQFDTDGSGTLNKEEGLAVLDNLKEMAGGFPAPPSGVQNPAGFEDQYRANAEGQGYSSSLLELLA